MVEFDRIQIIPLHTPRFLGFHLFEESALEKARVSNVVWSGDEFLPKPPVVSFMAYWSAYGSWVHEGRRVWILDLSGINRGDPDLDVMKAITKKDVRIFLDPGIRRTEDVADCLLLDIERVVASTRSLRSPQVLQEIFSLTENCLPCVDYSGGIPGAERSLVSLAQSILQTGYPAVAVLDVTRLGSGQRPDEQLLRALRQLAPQLYFGGGVEEEDVPSLEELGFRGALMEPFTPSLARRIASPEAPVSAPEGEKSAVWRPREMGAPGPSPV